MKNKKLLGEEKVLKLLFKLSAPAIIAMLINAVYNLVDTFFVGMLNDNASMGAVSIAFPIFMIVTAFGQAMGVGSGAFVSLLLGQKKELEAKRVIATSLVTSLVIGISFSILGYLFIDNILAVTGVEGELFAKSKDYLVYIILGSVFTILNMNLNNLIRAEGNAMYSMIAIILGAVINIALDPLLIFNMGMGVSGASLATTIAQGVSTIFLLGFYVCKVSSLGLDLKLFSPNLKIYKTITKIGLPSFARQSLSSIALGLVNLAVIPFGDSAVAAIGIILRVTSLGLYVLFGIAQGFQPIAAFNFGAGKIDRVKQAIKYALIISSLFSLVLTVSFVIFSKKIILIFSSHPEVVNIGSRSLVIITILFIANGFQILITTLFQALGKGRDSFILAISRQGIFFLPVILFLPKIMGFHGISFSFMIADGFAFLLTLFMYTKLLKDFKGTNESKLEFV